MPALPWSEFEKEELVELLGELEECRFTVEQLWSECDVHYVPSCSCSPSEHALPQRVLEIRDEVRLRIEKRAAAGRPRTASKPTSLLQRLLRRPFSKNRSARSDSTENRRAS